MNDRLGVIIAATKEPARGGLRDAVNKDGSLEILADLTSLADTVEQIRLLEPHILLIELGLAEVEDNLSIVTQAKEIRPNLAVIVVSSIIEAGATMKALAAGALEYVSKDGERLKSTPMEMQLAKALRSAKTVVAKQEGLTLPEHKRIGRTERRKAENPGTPSSVPRSLCAEFDLVLIGISTGGPSALEAVLSNLGDRDLPPILIVQHMGRLFTTQLAASLSRQSGRTVSEAWRQSPLEANSIYIAPGGFHTEVRNRAPDEDFHRLRVVEDEPVNGFRPSVDVTWKSVARHFKGRVAAFLMTGMGEDGAQGMMALKETGAICVAQDEESSVVWGMPGAAVRDQSCHEVLSLDQIAQAFAHGIKKARS